MKNPPDNPPPSYILNLRSLTDWAQRSNHCLFANEFLYKSIDFRFSPFFGRITSSQLFKTFNHYFSCNFDKFWILQFLHQNKADATLNYPYKIAIHHLEIYSRRIWQKSTVSFFYQIETHFWPISCLYQFLLFYFLFITKIYIGDEVIKFVRKNVLMKTYAARLWLTWGKH